jgi:hypothetical protein
MRFYFLLIIASLFAFTIVNSKKKELNQETCETVKFPGGDTAFGSFVYSNLDSKILTRYPDLKGTIYIEFIVDTTGKIISTEIKANKLNIQDSSKIIKEIRRVLLTSPKWEFYDLVKEDFYTDETKKDDRIIEFDNSLPVDDHLSIEETIDENNFKNNPFQKCKKLKARLIFPFKFPIPDFFLNPKK